MARMLHVRASPRGDASASIRVAGVFLESYLAAHAGDTVDTLDLFSEDLPVFDAPAAEAKYAVMAGSEPSGKAGATWRRVIAAVERFKSADKLLVSSPMWNFAVPYRLKQYIDVVVQPGLTFSAGPGGYKGLVTGRPALLILARGGRYTPGTGGEAHDMQRPYLEFILRFLGFEDVRTILVEPTLAEGPERARGCIQEAEEAARAAARGF